MTVAIGDRLRPLARLTPWALQARYAVQLVSERRLWLVLVVDAIILVNSLISTLISGGEANGVYRTIVLVPSLLLALPLMSTVLSLERRAGGLDLALAVPNTEAYFLRRIAPICGFFALQGVVVLLLLDYPKTAVQLGAVVQAILVNVLLAAIALFWAVRLRTTGAVYVASLLTVAVLSRWIFFAPFPDRYAVVERFHGIPVPLLQWSWNSVVLASATVIFYLYARGRLRHPETLL